MDKILIASSSSEAGLTKLINAYYYSTNWVIVDNRAYNTKTKKYAGEVVKKNGRYKFYN